MRDNQYKAISHTAPTIPVPLEDFESSIFTINNDLIQPEQYQFRTRDRKKKLDGKFTFDWQAKELQKKLQDETTATRTKISARTQDKITQFFQLRRD